MNRESSPAASPQIDEAAALAGLDGNRELFRDLAIMFCEDAPVVLDELQAAVAAQDASAARRAAHSLKGLAATFYAGPTVKLAEQAERYATAGDLEALQHEGILQLERSVSTLITELQARST